MTDPRPDDVLTVREAARALGRSPDHTRTLIYSGALPSELDARTNNYLIRRADLDAYLEGRTPGELSPMFAELGALDDLIQATETLHADLIRARNECMRHWRYDRGASVTAVATAARMGRQNATRILPKK